MQPATSNQQPATSNQQPATSNQQPATSNQAASTSLFIAACGVLLVLAGVLKIAYLVSVGRASEWPVEILMAIAAGELLTGVWFVVHAGRLVARIAGVVVFASLAIASATMHFYGIAACPCLGILHVSPLGMLVADIAILAGFIALCSTLVKSDIWQAALELKKSVVGNGRVVSLMVVLGALPIVSHVMRSVAPAGGVVIESSPIRIAAVHPMSETHIPVIVNNRTSQAANIFGGGTSCGCLTMTKLPVVVPANGQVELELVLTAPANTGPLNKRFVYYIQHPSQYDLPGEIEVNVVDATGINSKSNDSQIAAKPDLVNAK